MMHPNFLMVHILQYLFTQPHSGAMHNWQQATMFLLFSRYYFILSYAI